ncbi:MAG: hypothetical protein UT84_C0002G0078 [Candidatus Curtissbacteria bacterium GW2011_GWA1_40_16]|uniref:Uncharacterized protein n=1 Tax=Candidatus Curtissbacteria bacterium GW2011_GWA1_40_16 TaxID=1618405 RepID=A0A0G0ULX6_9BACT|nr:MAG: hypothetical protein UT84_C0002G0078 [Candidatus Curtissbacteria bacterium GW2011_GWA1_40_16]
MKKVYPEKYYYRRGFAPILIILFVISLVALGAIAYLQFKAKSNFQPASSKQTQSAAQKTGEIANLKSYRRVNEGEEDYELNCGNINNQFFDINCPKDWSITFRKYVNDTPRFLTLKKGDAQIDIQVPQYIEVNHADSNFTVDVVFLGKKIEAHEFIYYGKSPTWGKDPFWIITAETADRNGSSFLIYNKTIPDQKFRTEMLNIVSSFNGFKR